MKKYGKICIVLLLIISSTLQSQNNQKKTKKMSNTIAIATFGNGCFWCTEAIFQQLKGVQKVMPGYTGGTLKNPTYKEVCSGLTGHAEAIQITYDTSEISYRELLDVFFYTHDPTTLNRQGNDVGTQYRSAIFYHDENQKAEAEKIIEQLTKEKVYDDAIVTEVVPFTIYYAAEDYHKDYYNNNKNQPYCRAVINPKIDKFLKKYGSKIK
jgi:peptide-methionine (S)-S-oxide reductase